MWIFTEVADWFDKVRHEDEQFLDQTFQGWVDYAVKHEDEQGFYPALRNFGIYAGTGLLYSTFKLSTTVAAGFVDTLRIGDGIKKGGWGYAEDALRFLVVAGPALRAARFGVATVASLDLFKTTPTCTWIGVVRALRLTGVKNFVSLETLSKAAGFTDAWDLLVRGGKLEAGSWIDDLMPVVRSLGGSIKQLAPQGDVLKTLAGVVAKNAEGVVIFSVRWKWAQGVAKAGSEFRGVIAGEEIGHTMLAYRNPLTGALKILDRSGKIYDSFAAMEGSYSGISSATFYANGKTTLAFIANAAPVMALKAAGTAAAAGQVVKQFTEAIASDFGDFSLTSAAAGSGLRWIVDSDVIDQIGFEVRSIPFRVSEYSSKRVLGRPKPKTANGTMETSVFCSRMNSDMPETCSSFYHYRVQPGDTLTAIAQLAYGDGNLWPKIQAYNPQIGTNPAKLKPGLDLLIP